MPAAFVDLLKVVEIADEQRQILAALEGCLDGRFEPFVERPSVGEAGERVLERQLHDMGEQLGAADRRGNLAAHRLEETDLAVGEGRPARISGHVELSPHAVGEADRHDRARSSSEPLQHLDLGIGRRTVGPDLLRPPVAQELLEEGKLLEGVGLLARAALLPGSKIAGVDDRAQHSGGRLPARYRSRGGAERLADLVRGGLGHVFDAMAGRGRGGDREQGPQLSLGRRRADLGRGGQRFDVRARAGLERGDECVDDLRVELTTGAATNLLERPTWTEGLAVGTVGGEGVKSVAGQHDPRCEGDLLTDQAVRIPGAVPVLVLVTYCLSDPTESGQRTEDALAHGGVLAHGLPFAGGEPVWLCRTASGTPILPMSCRRAVVLTSSSSSPSRPRRRATASESPCTASVCLPV